MIMAKNSINIVVAGATGYVGLDLVYLLSKHLILKLSTYALKKVLVKT